MPIKVEKYVTIGEAAYRLHRDVDAISEMLRNGKFASAIEHEDKWMLPFSELVPLLPVSLSRKDKRGMTRFSEHKRSIAVHKYQLLLAHVILVAKYRRVGHSMPEARAQGSETCNVPLRTMQRWQSRFRRYGLRGLIDGRGGGKRRSKER